MRRAFIAILIGVMLGGVGGLAIGWLVLPTNARQSPMSDLARRYKDDYTALVAAGYLADGDLQAAIDRLAPLRVGNVFTYVRDVAERYISQQRDAQEIRGLVILSCAMGYCTAPMQPFLLPTPTPAAP